MPNWEQYASDGPQFALEREKATQQQAEVVIEHIKRTHKWECPQIADLNIDGIMRDATQEDVDGLMRIKEAYSHLKWVLTNTLREVDLMLSSKNVMAAEEDEMKDFTKEQTDNWYNSRTKIQDEQREKDGWKDPLQEMSDQYLEYMKNKEPEFQSIAINT